MMCPDLEEYYEIMAINNVKKNEQPQQELNPRTLGRKDNDNADAGTTCTICTQETCLIIGNYPTLYIKYQACTPLPSPPSLRSGGPPNRGVVGRHSKASFDALNICKCLRRT